MRFLGIDPGASGGFAYIDDDGHVNAWPMPKSLVDVYTGLDFIKGAHCVAMLENVHATPQMGVTSAFTFGHGFGALRMALVALGIPYDLVAPLKWQNALDVRTPPGRRAELGHKDKNITKRKAAELFPHLTVTHATADALLIAVYCRQIKGSQLWDDDQPISTCPTWSQPRSQR